MKSILISIRPEWVAKILNGEKTIEIRKTAPKCDLPIDVYIYCTKSKDLVEYSIDGNLYFDEKGAFFDTVIHHDKKILNGKVVAKFTLRKVEEIKPKSKLGLLLAYSTYETETLVINPLLDKCCLTYEELNLYLNLKNGYAWHISDLVIFDKPKKLNEFMHLVKYRNFGQFPCVICEECRPLEKAPQSWCYVEAEE